MTPCGSCGPAGLPATTATSPRTSCGRWCFPPAWWTSKWRAWVRTGRGSASCGGARCGPTSGRGPGHSPLDPPRDRLGRGRYGWGMSVDMRTRVDGDEGPIDPARFFQDDLPAALEPNGTLLAPACATLPLPPLVVDVEGTAWTLHTDGARGDVRGGGSTVEGALRLRVDGAQLSDLVADQVTPMGWFSSGALDLDGRLERLLDWWLVLRGGLDGVEPHLAGALSFEDLGGNPVDLEHAFAWDDADEDMDRFLGQAGFVHVTGVFT